ncbi:Phytoene/squalene synthetase [Propionibacterium cyclohexanicum]|uniref:Phytoene/squalene synthetase n=1 Tax=Propionibacterium cyclohexanicum TaxID=64702 RepID=A0A1H9TJW1_9ACTN|nr:squalene/phytoene synthase family protein [Propionibacterium cyclohexanicum]SER97431.1 Phytoene/squalene synthetase [Propionibacterium cyclohexanicum]
MSAARPDTDRAALDLYTEAAGTVASRLIATYSTSFGLATHLLGRRHRQHVHNIYAMVRVADEIVDGVAAQAGLDACAQRASLEDYVAQTHRAMHVGYSNNIVLHAFAVTARHTGIDESLTQPFFDSMRADLDAAGDNPGGLHVYTPADHQRYVHGSAEVVGLMCLRVFLSEEQPSPAEMATLEHGARQLGAAFQNVNFLRDLAEDTDRLQRSYLAGVRPLDDAGRDLWVATVRSQLDDARRSIALLPADCRAAVRSALALFSAVTDRVARTPAQELYRRRVRVADPIKLALGGREVLRTWLEGR